MRNLLLCFDLERTPASQAKPSRHSGPSEVPELGDRQRRQMAVSQEAPESS